MNWVKHLFYARSGAKVIRFHTRRVIHRQNMAEHSWGVAKLCDVLTKGQASAQLLRYALDHDMGELETGDIPATTKWKHPKLKAALSEVEDRYLDRNGFATELNNAEELLVFKWADMLEFAFYCLDEKQLGNKNVEQGFQNAVDYLLKLEYHELGHDVLRQLCAAWSSAAPFDEWSAHYDDFDNVPVYLRPRGSEPGTGNPGIGGPPELSDSDEIPF